jgi:predicted TPR repeat methyltransferase
MIERARATGLYAQLEMTEMVEGLSNRPDASADLILAADAMVYLSDFAVLLREARRVLAVGGLLAFTVETHGGDGVILGEGLRYAHGARYVRAAIAAAGLTLSRLELLSARNEDNTPVPGLVAVAAKS